MDAAAAPSQFGRRRHFAVDDRGTGLPATWHLERGLVNLSLWRHDRGVETFHSTPVEAADLVGFLAAGLADAVAPTPASRPLAAVPDPGSPIPATDRRPTAAAGLRRVRRRLLPQE
jgi:hypothetical protein